MIWTAGLLPLAVCQQTDLSADTATIAEQYLLAAANQERIARGLSVLRRDPTLAQVAAEHAREMAVHGTISHQFPGEPELSNRGASAGIAFSVISENVAEAPSAVQIHDMWMHSEHHRENLLDPAIDSAGISVIARGGELYAVEDFVKSVRSASLDQQEASIEALIARQGPIALDTSRASIAAARQTCAMQTGYAGAVKPWFVMRFTSDSLTQLPEQLKARMDSGRYHKAAVGACSEPGSAPFTSYNFAVLLYP
ncbi:MAG TPA: CAP domain-containing protein [Terracidiphilus sp.]|nr:CAP domain-containing protein [Terracidiphilus sp.]